MRSNLSEIGFLREKQILGDQDSDPVIQPIIPVSRTTWWAGVRSGRFPRPVKIGPRATAWRIRDIQKLIEQLASEGQP